MSKDIEQKHNGPSELPTHAEDGRMIIYAACSPEMAQRLGFATESPTTVVRGPHTQRSKDTTTTIPR